MLRYEENIIIPFVNRKRQELLHPVDQEALIIERIRCGRSWLVTSNSFTYQRRTSELQPLDAEGSVNASSKMAFKGAVQAVIFRTDLETASTWW